SAPEGHRLASDRCSPRQEGFTMPDPSLIVSVSGIRGILGKGLTPEATTAFAAALGTYVKGGPVVLSRDGRPSGILLGHAVLAGLLSAGCNVHDIGVAPTPTFCLAVRRR